MEWISVEDQLPPFDIQVKVKVPDLRHPWKGLEVFLPKGEYISIYQKKSKVYCCNNPRHEHHHNQLKWSNDAGYYATHWMPLPEAPKE